jgi:hypothetical protein
MGEPAPPLWGGNILHAPEFQAGSSSRSPSKLGSANAALKRCATQNRLPAQINLRLFQT